MVDAVSNRFTKTSICQWNHQPFSSDTALAPFEPFSRKCVSHAKWRTDVVYGQSNIVLHCLHCTWWYGANRGICQMQSGVMEGRDRGRTEKEGGSGGLNSLSPVKVSSEHQLWGHQKTKLPLKRVSSAPKGECRLQETLITPERKSKSTHSTLYFHEDI